MPTGHIGYGPVINLSNVFLQTNCTVIHNVPTRMVIKPRSNRVVSAESLRKNQLLPKWARAMKKQ